VLVDQDGFRRPYGGQGHEISTLHKVPPFKISSASGTPAGQAQTSPSASKGNIRFEDSGI